jgi:LysM repeat protein
VARRSATTARPVRRGEQYAPVRLTRRGKIVAQILLIATAVLAVVGIAAGTRAAADGPEPSGPRPSVVVHEGDTLWNIADRHAPNFDRRAVMDEIRRLNDLDGSTVEVGQKLVLPRQ